MYTVCMYHLGIKDSLVMYTMCMYNLIKHKGIIIQLITCHIELIARNKYIN